MQYTVIAPAYNEEENVTPLVERIAQVMSVTGLDYDILIIDDGSTDGTLGRLRQLMVKYPNLSIVSLAENSGQTVALQAGFDYAEGDRVITLDSDLERDPAHIPDMIEKLECENLDLVYSSKVYKNVPFKRKLASYIANSFRRAITGDTAKDVGSAFVVYRKNFFRGRNFHSGFHRFFLGFMEVEGLRAGSIPGPVFKRPYGKTKYTNWGRFKQGLADMFYYYLYKNRNLRVHRIIFASAIILVLTMYAPLTADLKRAIFAAIIFVFAFTISMTLHAVHQLVLQKRLPYEVRQILRRM